MIWICRCCVENSNAIENIIHPTLYFVITEHFGDEHFYKETEKHNSFLYSKVDCGAKDSISLKDLVKLQFKITTFVVRRSIKYFQILLFAQVIFDP